MIYDVAELEGSFAIHGDSTAKETIDHIRELVDDSAALILTDPPYRGILLDSWDHEITDETEFVDWMIGTISDYSKMLLDNAAFYIWGGIGTPRFRPFIKLLARVEDGTPLLIANVITWKKKRAYGIQHNYLFTKEEAVYLFKGEDIKKPRVLNVPLLSQERGYAGYNEKYPAKSKFLRRANVWTDITEILRGKVHTAQKPQALFEVPILAHTNPGEWVVDPFAGSGTTAFAAAATGRKFVIVEKDKAAFDLFLKRWKDR